jgi:hypothetical protein
LASNTGDLTLKIRKKPGPKPIPTDIRFWKNVEITIGSCWIWTAYKKPNGYGQFNEKIGTVKKTLYAHRFSYEMKNGHVPEGLELDHHCRMRSCVNPDHLEAVTRYVNVHRSVLPPPSRNAMKMFCDQGHRFDHKNTWHEMNKDDSVKGRHCRECHRIREAARRDRLRGEVAA